MKVGSVPSGALGRLSQALFPSSRGLAGSPWVPLAQGLDAPGSASTLSCLRFYLSGVPSWTPVVLG